MRVFIAIDLPQEIEDYFKEIQNQIKSNVKLSLAKDSHLTLKFLGEIDQEKVDDTTEKLNKIKFAKFKIRLSEIGFFPSENYVRVVWIGIIPVEEINGLQKRVDSALKQFPSDFKFHPHITLARVKFIEGKKEFIDKIKNIKIKPIEFEVSNFKLIKSTLTPEGPVYEDLATFNSVGHPTA